MVKQAIWVTQDSAFPTNPDPYGTPWGIEICSSYGKNLDIKIMVVDKKVILSLKESGLGRHNG